MIDLKKREALVTKFMTGNESYLYVTFFRGLEFVGCRKLPVESVAIAESMRDDFVKTGLIFD